MSPAARLIVAWLILAALMFAVMVLTGCQRSSQSALDRLHPCKIDEGPTEAFCGTYNVFENRSTKAGRQIALKIVVAPALKRDPQPDPLLILEGGPGAGRLRSRTAFCPCSTASTWTRTLS